MICESLGYFTPQAAANAILHYKNNEPYFCEWYVHMARYEYDREKIKEVGKNVIKYAFKNRKHHKGYMSDYKLAKRIVLNVLQGGNPPEFASWF